MDLNWEQITLIYLLAVKFITGLRDAIDKTPTSDDNWFERICSILGKTVNYVTFGARPK